MHRHESVDLAFFNGKAMGLNEIGFITVVQLRVCEMHNGSAEIVRRVWFCCGAKCGVPRCPGVRCSGRSRFQLLRGLDGRSPSKIFCRVAYSVEPLGFRLVLRGLSPPMPESGHGGLGKRPYLLQELEDRQEYEFQ